MSPCVYTCFLSSLWTVLLPQARWRACSVHLLCAGFVHDAEGYDGWPASPVLRRNLKEMLPLLSPPLAFSPSLCSSSAGGKLPAIILNGKLPVPPGKVESLLQVLKCFDVFIVTYPEYEALARALAVNASRICIAPEPSRYVINTTTTRRLHFTPISEVLKFLRQCSVPDTEFDAWSTDGGVSEMHHGAINQWITLHAALRGSFVIFSRVSRHRPPIHCTRAP